MKNTKKPINTKKPASAKDSVKTTEEVDIQLLERWFNVMMEDRDFFVQHINTQPLSFMEYHRLLVYSSFSDNIQLFEALLGHPAWNAYADHINSPSERFLDITNSLDRFVERNLLSHLKKMVPMFPAPIKMCRLMVACSINHEKTDILGWALNQFPENIRASNQSILASSMGMGKYEVARFVAPNCPPQVVWKEYSHPKHREKFDDAWQSWPSDFQQQMLQVITPEKLDPKGVVHAAFVARRLHQNITPKTLSSSKKVM